MTRPLSKKAKAAKEAFEAEVREEFAAVRAAVEAIEPPEGHRWEVSPNWDSWFCGDLSASIHNTGASIMLRKTASACEDPCTDPDQVHAEIRLFWTPPGQFSYRPRNAIAWIEHGARIWGSPRTILAPDGSAYRDCDEPAGGVLQRGHRHLYAGGAESMLALVVEVVRSAFDANRRRMMATTEAMAA